MSIQIGKPLLITSTEIVKIDLGGCSLLAVIDPSRKSGVLVQARSTATPADWQTWVNESKTLLEISGHSRTEIIVKIIRSNLATASPLDLFPPSEFKNVREVVQNTADSTVFFHPTESRLRLGTLAPVPQTQAPEFAQQETKIKVLVVDDSKTIRDLLKRIIESDPKMQVVAAAERPSEVTALIEKFRPDVITLDIHMPEMDGVTLLSQFYPKYRIPTVMISSITREEGDFVLRALEIGAVDYIQKPTLKELSVVGPLIIEKLKIAAASKAALQLLTSAGTSSVPFDPVAITSGCMIAIGSSTGGTEALRAMLGMYPAQIPPVVIVQHIPAVFSAAFAARLNQICPFEVKEAADGDLIQPNRVLIAPGGFQMEMVRSGQDFKVRVYDAAPVNRHKPSVDVLFDSVAKLHAKKTIGVILTGIGADGAKGLLAMRKAGSKTYAQDEASCVVFGMPRVAIELGAAEEIKPLSKMAAATTDGFNKILKKRAA